MDLFDEIFGATSLENDPLLDGLFDQDKDTILDQTLETTEDQDLLSLDVEPMTLASIEGIGGAKVLEYIKTHPDVIRDAELSALKREMSGLSKKDISYVMQERKAMRNRLSAHRCAKSRQGHIQELQKRCEQLQQQQQTLLMQLEAKDKIIADLESIISPPM